jgi:hypothetical protein
MTRTTSLMEQIAMAEKKKFKCEARMGNVSRLPIFSRIFLNFFFCFFFITDTYPWSVESKNSCGIHLKRLTNSIRTNVFLVFYLAKRKKNCFHCSDDVNWSLHALYLSNSGFRAVNCTRVQAACADQLSAANARVSPVLVKTLATHSATVTFCPNLYFYTLAGEINSGSGHSQTWPSRPRRDNNAKKGGRGRKANARGLARPGNHKKKIQGHDPTPIPF